MQPGPAERPSTEATWHDIFTGTDHTGQTWACIAVAIAHADNLLTQVARMSAATGQRPRHESLLWTQMAASTYHQLTTTGAYRHKEYDQPGMFVADESAITTWLNAPDPDSPGGDRTMAAILEIDDNFLLDDGARPGRIVRLVDEAQTAGVLRGPTMRVEIWNMADDEGDLVGHRVAVHRDGNILASHQIDAADLVDESLTGIEAAVAVLQNIADVATDMVIKVTGSTPSAAPAALTEAEVPPIPTWAQAFRPGGRTSLANRPAASRPPDLNPPGEQSAPGPHR
jgi:hypothetical protein